MPRPKNLYLLHLFGGEIQGNTIACNNGHCNGKFLNTHGANLERHLKQLHPDLYTYYLQQKCENQKILSPKMEKMKKYFVPNNNNMIETKFFFSSTSFSSVNTTKSLGRIKESQGSDGGGGGGGGGGDGGSDYCGDYGGDFISEGGSLGGNLAGAGVGVQRNDLQLALVDFFTKNIWAMSLIEDQAFNLLMKPTFQILQLHPTKENINLIIFEYFQKWKEYTKYILRGKLISLKLDVVKCKERQIVGLSVQYMEINYIKSITLSIKDIKDNNDLKILIENILKDYQIDRKQIVTITMEEVINSLPLTEENKEENTSEDMEMENSFLPDLKTQLNFFTSNNIPLVHCGSDIFMRCAQDVLEIPNVLEKLKKFKLLSQKMNTQKHINLEGEQDSIKNWIFLYEKLEILLEFLKALDPQSTENLNEEELNFLMEFIKLFNPLYKATVKLQREQQSWSDLYIVIMDVLFQIKDMTENDLKQLLVKALTQCKDELFEIDLFTAAIYLDPRIKICLKAEEKERAKKCITEMGRRLSELKDFHPDNFEITIKDENPASPSDTSIAASEASAIPSSPNDSLSIRSFSDYLYNLETSTIDESKYDPFYIGLETDFILYERLPRLPLDLNLITHWTSQQSSLAAIANIILAIPCTIQSNSMKSLMATLTSLCGQQRAQVSPNEWEQFMLVRINGEFVYNQ